MLPELSFEQIIPNHNDETEYRHNVILQVAYILTHDVSALKPFRSSLPCFVDPSAIPSHKTERYYLSTLDQEQGSTRGNIEVIHHYFL